MGCYGTKPSPLPPTDMSRRATDEDRRIEQRLADMEFEAAWQQMLEADARAERFWDSAHEFWKRYDRGEEQPNSNK